MNSIIRLYLINILGASEEMARVIICQAAHESAFWTSNVYEHSNNMFGMKTHGRKVKYKNDNSLNYKGYATYINYQGSVEDVVDWLKRRKIFNSVTSIPEYVSAIRKAGYFEAPEEEYKNGMLNAYKRLYPESWHKYNGL